ncbi:hypothetical protein [Paenibacillus sp. MSJ-34]|uniref:hypothetical protein n=1 Tax=Paenibacillus sp. MSJ-34 TaxID=2841529 RepID=UPI001C0F8777|nr:hypothetical protein [Paenibacillus sp. MSJ-34]MBU5442052.1 hypothetical protein [Paenibacillus sp. MSJ-34]
MEAVQINPTNAINRLYEYLSHVKVYPTPLRFTAIVAGISDAEVERILTASPYYAVYDGEIYSNEASYFNQTGGLRRMDNLSVIHAYGLYQMLGIAFLCEDGRPIAAYVEGDELA